MFIMLIPYACTQLKINRDVVTLVTPALFKRDCIETMEIGVVLNSTQWELQDLPNEYFPYKRYLNSNLEVVAENGEPYKDYVFKHTLLLDN